MKCKNCGTDLKYLGAAQNHDHIKRIYHCAKCDTDFETTSYVHTPSTCPKHHWGFQSWGFSDSPYTHEIYWNMQCDRCGAKAKKRWDSNEVGLRQAVDIQDPRVLPNLEWTPETVRFHLPSEDVKEFWES